MSDTRHEINLALRTAAGHERAAHAAEATGAKQYEMKMKSAGASVFEAFKLAIVAAPEYRGRKIDDAAMRRIYSSTKPRPWWDVHLKAVKVEGKPADREWGKRLIQWHLDPEAAAARRAHGNARRLANHAKTQKKSASQGGRSPQAAPERHRAPNAAEMEAIALASTETALASRELPQAMPVVTEGWELHVELKRISSAVGKVKREDYAAVLEVLQTTAREVERYVA